MNLFATPMSAPDADMITTCENKRVPWNWGLKLPPMTKEARAKASATLKGRIKSEEHRANMSAAASKGRIMSEETRAKISATKLNKAKPLMTPNGLYPSRRAVVEAAGVTWYAVNCWMRLYPEHYYYIEEAK